MSEGDWMTQLDERATATALQLRVGDVVEVKSAEEILATLDERGELDNLPFMPEMLAFCGRRMTVHKVAHKLCDALTWSGMHKMSRAVHLTGARCDGSAHGGCQTACSLYWKDEWLRKLDEAEPAVATTPLDEGTRRLLPILEVNTQRGTFEDGAPRYACQATEILRAAPEPLPLKDLSQFVDDVRVGNAGVLFVLRAVLVGVFNRVQSASRSRLPERLRFRDGLSWGFIKGRVIGRTPTEVLNLQPGERVRIKSREEIMATLDENLLNRGMGFDAEMSRHCGRVAVVQSRVDRCLDERSGRLLTMKNPCIVLERTVCTGAFTSACPREYVPFWREIWLERV
jgi:hypothetical protein